MTEFHEQLRQKKDGQTEGETIAQIQLDPVGGMSQSHTINYKEPTNRIDDILDAPVANGTKQEEVVKEGENQDAQQCAGIEV